MKGLKPLFLGIFATFAFSWLGLALIPNAQIGHLNPQSDEEGTDIYPMPLSGMAERGRQVYTSNGCFYCHSQQVRADYAASDIERKWGARRSAPRDYVFARPVMLGTNRMGPDLANLGKRAPADDQNEPAQPTAPTDAPAAGAPAPGGATGPAPAPTASSSSSSSSPVAVSSSPAVASVPPAATKATAAASPATASPAPPAAAPGPAPAATSLDSAPAPGVLPTYSPAWHHQHLYSPRSINRDSIMPAYRFLYEERRISGERSADALNLKGADAPRDGWEVVPSYEAKSLVAYLMSLDQSHALKEVKSAVPPSPPAPGKAATK